MSANLHQLIQQPKNINNNIWRYMNLAKFIILLKDQALYLSRLDKMNDRFEGLASHASIQSRANRYPELVQKAFPMIDQTYTDSKKWSYANCWHMSDCESAAMWKIYASEINSVAIKTTYEQLFNLLPEKTINCSIYMGIVTYYDYEKDLVPEGNSLALQMYKRNEYQYENEVRALIQEYPITQKDGKDKINFSKINNKNGINVHIEIKKLINEVIVSPASSAWFYDLVVDVCKKYQYNIEIKKSSLM